MLKSTEDHPNRGAILLSAVVSESGYCITRKRLHESIKRVDPVSREHRRMKRVKRRVYREAGHHLRHLDTNHKMV